MSYILDALKKLDKKHKRGSIPDIMTLQEPKLRKPVKRPLWPYLLFFALTINAVLFAAWLRPWEKSKPEVIEQPAVKQEAMIIAGDAITRVPDEQAAISAEKGNTVNAPVQEVRTAEDLSAIKSNTTVPAPAETPVKPEPQSLSKTVKSYEPERIMEKQEITSDDKLILETSSDLLINTADTKTVPEEKIQNIDNIPTSVRQDIPKISISAHIYSNAPASRLVTIDGQVVREGDSITNELKLKEITPVGAVFSFRGHVFQIRRF